MYSINGVLKIIRDRRKLSGKLVRGYNCCYALYEEQHRLFTGKIPNSSYYLSGFKDPKSFVLKLCRYWNERSFKMAAIKGMAAEGYNVLNPQNNAPKNGDVFGVNLDDRFTFMLFEDKSLFSIEEDSGRIIQRVYNKDDDIIIMARYEDWSQE